jgi:DNA repair ATPase RecN
VSDIYASSVWDDIRDNDIRVATTVIDNCGGLKHLEIDHTSPVIYVTGENGSGKTSLLQAYELVFDGGNRPDWIGPYGDKATILLTLSDGTTIKRVQGKTGAQYTIINGDGQKIERPAEYVKKLVSGTALKPAELLRAKKEERIEILQSILQLEFTKAELDKACGRDTFAKKPVYTLDEFDAFVEGTREKRKEANSKQDTLGSSLRTLKADLPEGDGDGKDWATEVRRLQTAIQTNSNDLTALSQKAYKQLQQAIDDRKAELAKAIAALQEEAEADITGYRNEMSQVLAGHEAPLKSERDKLNQDLAVAQQNERNTAALAAKRQTIAKIDKDYRDAVQEHSFLDDAVKGLEKLRLEKMNASPIKGVEIKGKDIYLDGLNIDTQVNQASKILVACQIMARVNRGMNFFILEGAELDDDTADMLAESCKEKGFQLVLAAPKAGKPLTVEAK